MAKKTEFNVETVKKYALWVALPIALLLTAGGTVMAVSKVNKEFRTKSGTLESKKKAVEGIARDSAHPNQNTIDDIKGLRNVLLGYVHEAWRILEADQKDRNRFPAELGVSVVAEMERKRFGDLLTRDALENYLVFIRRYVPGLEVYVDRRRVQVKIDGQWVEYDPIEHRNIPLPNDPFAGLDDGMGGANRRTSRAPSSSTSSTISRTGSSNNSIIPRGEDGEALVRWVGKVVWEEPETRKNRWESLPKSKEVWYAQEELWVYNALLSVIERSNAEATGPHNARVKRIDALLIGQDAAPILQELSAARIGMNRMNAAGGSGGYGSGAGMGSGYGSGTGSSSGGVGSASDMIIRTEADVDRVKREFRYVDENGVPLAATAAAPYPEFNRMPVCMRLLVDQKEIPRILVNCANCDMPIDILWVRINPDAAEPFDLDAHDPTAVDETARTGSGSSGSSYPPSMGSGSSGRNSSAARRNSNGSTASGGRRSGNSSSPSGSSAYSDPSSDVQVVVDGIGGLYGTDAILIEIVGCINIYNPVDNSTLETSVAVSQ